LYVVAKPRVSGFAAPFLLTKLIHVTIQTPVLVSFLRAGFVVNQNSRKVTVINRLSFTVTELKYEETRNQFHRFETGGTFFFWLKMPLSSRPTRLPYFSNQFRSGLAARSSVG
jgi:hypothetical protein